jgi:phenylacetate-coenzyme A ligase PaaK-like adenylate-forming protein
MHPPGVANFLTGGTLASPKLCPMGAVRLRHAVQDAEVVLRASGLDRHDRILIGFPFDPWAIGSIFRDAAIAIGASVFPAGLKAADPALGSHIEAFRPTAVCASWRLFTRIAEQRGGMRAVRTVVHAGEPLPDHLDRSAYPGTGITNVYGCAEYDSVGYAPFGSPFGINPRIAVRIDPGIEAEMESRNPDVAARVTQPAEERSRGELLIRWVEPPPGEPAGWHRTGDLAEAVPASSSGSHALGKGPGWNSGTMFRIIGRLDEHLDFADGTTISRACLRDALGVVGPSDGVQIVVRRRDLRDFAHVRIHTDSDRSADAESIRERLLTALPELADVVQSGIAEVGVSVLHGQRMLETPRGKVPFIVRECDA